MKSEGNFDCLLKNASKSQFIITAIRAFKPSKLNSSALDSFDIQKPETNNASAVDVFRRSTQKILN